MFVDKRKLEPAEQGVQVGMFTEEELKYELERAAAYNKELNEKLDDEHKKEEERERRESFGGVLNDAGDAIGNVLERGLKGGGELLAGAGKGAGDALGGALGGLTPVLLAGGVVLALFVLK